MVALATTAIAWVFFAIVTIGWIVYYFINRGSARPELGSEAQVAPNRKKYFEDEELEGGRLERMQVWGVLLLVVITIGLPLYWFFEPNRQAGAIETEDRQFIQWGRELFATTAEGGFNCAGCHGGMNATGGVAPYALTDSRTGEVRSVSWYAPALNSVLYRYDEDEVQFILEYGRPFSPMAAWGTVGGGPMNFQQIETLISYIRSIQIPRIGCLEGEDPLTCPTGEIPEDTQADITAAIDRDAQELVDGGRYGSVAEARGEAIFNLDLASGAYSCARCHTRGWSYGDPGVAGQGAFGWNLTGGSTNDHFRTEEEMVTFIQEGSVYGERYGIQSQGSGRMPGFGAVLTDEQITAVVEYVRTL